MDLIIKPFRIHSPNSETIVFSGDKLAWSNLYLVTGDNLDHARAVALSALNFDARILEASGYKVLDESKEIKFDIPSVSYVSSNPKAEISRFTQTVREELVLGLSTLLDSDEAASCAEKIAQIVEISDLLDRNPASLSGGETARVILAAHLVRSPKIWLIDQLLEELDLNYREKFIDFLFGYCRNNSAMAFILDDVRLFSHKGRANIWYVRGESVKINPPIDEIDLVKYFAIPDQLSINPFSFGQDVDEIALKVEGLCVSRSGREIIDNLSFTCKYGQLYWVFGRNGAGKTTLLETLVGLSECNRGQISFHKNGIKDNLFSVSSYSPQHPDIDITESTLIDEVAFAHKPSWRISKDSRDFAEEWLLRKGIGKNRLSDPIYYSMSQKKFASVLASFARNKTFIALDEPTLLLGKKEVEIIASLIVKYVNEKHLVMVATHDQRLIDAVCKMKR